MKRRERRAPFAAPGLRESSDTRRKLKLAATFKKPDAQKLSCALGGRGFIKVRRRRFCHANSTLRD
jgi:hypothetical protein